MATKRREKRIRDVVAHREKGLILVLEDIHDPHNAEAVLRSCDAFGVQEVCFVFEKEKRFNPRRVGRVTSASANKWLTFRVFDSTKKCFAYLRRKKCVVIATTLQPSARPIGKVSFAVPRIAIMMGNEHRGLSTYAVSHADFSVTIPMRGMVESLNLSVSTALFLYEATRQRAVSGKSFHLSKKEQNALAKDFLSR